MTLRPELLPYLLVMAGVTYLIRALPLVLCRRKIQNRYLLSFLYYMPYAVLSAMTVPAIFFATESILAASAGFLVALVLAFFKRSLITVASGAVVGVLLTSLLETYVFPLYRKTRRPLGSAAFVQLARINAFVRGWKQR